MHSALPAVLLFSIDAVFFSLRVRAQDVPMAMAGSAGSHPAFPERQCGGQGQTDTERT